MSSSVGLLVAVAVNLRYSQVGRRTIGRHLRRTSTYSSTRMKNRRAAYTLAHAQTESDWLSASWERFGRQQPSPAKGLLAIGDSAAFIDPFTGSGMLLAFESGELVADVINRHPKEVEADYTAEYLRKFESRLRISGWLRRAAFKPRLAGIGIALCSASKHLRSRLVRATRSSFNPASRSV